MTTARSIDEILKTRKIIITSGTGGVGKTTLSAAIALRAALLGKKTVVITVDPAKRLATSLGLDRLGDHATDLTPALKEIWKQNEKPGEITGSLFAIVPDTKRTFEDFLHEISPSKEIVDRVLRNPIFQIFTKEFSGANEYMALERLQALNRSGIYDTIILDTPPSRNTLAFLEAPKLLAKFFEEKLVRWLVLPANKIVSAGMKKALGILEKLTGAGFMTNLFDFASTLFEVRVRFLANMKQTTQLLESTDVGFLVVTAPTPETGPEVNHFIEMLKSHRFNFDGVALNRTLGYLKIQETPESQARFPKAFEVLYALQAREVHAIETLRRTSVPICATLPELARDVHSLEDLFHVAMAFDSNRT